jgi:CRP-like cAMP-binding protein
MWVYFNVDFRFGPGEVVRVIEEALAAAPIEGVAASPLPNVVCLDFAKDGRDSFAYYAVRYWLTDLARDDPTSSRVRMRVHAALKRAGIPLAVPAAQLFVDQDDVARRERKKQRDNERRLSALSALEFLKPLTAAEREEVADHLRYAPFAAGETITRQGAVAHWLYVLTKGTAEVHRRAEEADKLIAQVIAPGFFGEMGLMTGAPRTATVIALTDVECYRLDKIAFERILSERPEIAAEMAHLLATRLVGIQAVAKDLDEAARAKHLESERRKILATIQEFFGLRDSAA